MLAATWPTCSLSMPDTMMRVGTGTSNVMPCGASMWTGWLKPSASSSLFGPCAVARYPTPTISSSLVKPAVTPTTMLLTSDRVRPCSARFSRSSSGRSTRIVESSWRTLMTAGRSRSSWPLGPFTRTWPSPIVTSTPEGSGMGERPIRDISSPHVAEDLAALATLARLSVGHEALVGGQDSDTEAAQHAGQTVGLGVDAEPGLRHPAQAGDRAVALGRVLHRDLEEPARTSRVVAHGEALDIALALKDGRERLLQLRGRHAHLVVHRHVGVAEAGEHVGDRVGHRHRRTSPLTSSPSSRRAPRRRAPSRGGRCGRARTGGTPRKAGHTAGTACTRAP